MKLIPVDHLILVFPCTLLDLGGMLSSTACLHQGDNHPQESLYQLQKKWTILFCCCENPFPLGVNVFGRGHSSRPRSPSTFCLLYLSWRNSGVLRAPFKENCQTFSPRRNGACTHLSCLETSWLAGHYGLLARHFPDVPEENVRIQLGWLGVTSGNLN